MESVLKIVMLVVAVLLIVVSLLQGGKSDGLSAFTGSGDLGLFQNVKERGPEKVISIVTLVLGIVLFILAIVINVIQ